MLYNVYYKKSALNVFQNISSYEENSIKIANGYTFNDHIWGILFNAENDKRIGIIIANSYYVHTDTIGGHIKDDIILFIENELPIGSINYLYDLYSPLDNTIIPPSKNNYPTVRALSGYYYGKNISLKLDISDSETRNITIYID